MGSCVYLLIFLLFSLIYAETPITLQTIDVTVGQFSPGEIFDDLDGDDMYDVEDVVQSLHVLYDETTQCYIYWTHKRIYRGNCGSSTLSMPTFPLTGMSDTGGPYKYDDVEDGEWDSNRNDDSFNLDDSGNRPAMKFMRVFMSGYQSGIRVRWYTQGGRNDELFFTQYYNGSSSTVHDYQLGPTSRTDVHRIRLDEDDKFRVREIRFYNELPSIIERYFIATQDTDRGFSSCGTQTGYLHCIIDRRYLSLDLSKPGVAHRTLTEINDASEKYELPQFILPVLSTDWSYMIIQDEDNDLYELWKVNKKNPTQLDPLDSSPWGSEIISNVASVEGYSEDNPSYIVTSESGKLYGLYDFQVYALSGQLGLGISSMQFTKKANVYATGWLTLNVDLGLILQVDIGFDLVVTITNVIVLGDEKPHTMILDSERNGLIILADNGVSSTVYIVPTLPSLKSTEYIKVYDDVLFSDDAVYDSANMNIRVSQRECTGTCAVYKLELENCTAYSCADCGQINPVFCGSCSSSSSCHSDSTCTASDFQRGRSCPYIISSSPLQLRGTSEGGTTTTFFFAGDRIPDVQCIFDGVAVPSNASGETSFSCVAPPHPEGTVTITFSHYSEAFSFVYYDCSQFSCSECLRPIYGECGWISDLASCGSKGTNTNAFCPVITSINPNEILLPSIDESGVSIVVGSTGLSQEATYRCQFVETGVNTSADKITVDNEVVGVNCNTPGNSTLAPFKSIPITVTLLSTLNEIDWHIHTQTQSVQNLLVNFCDDISLCSRCLNLGCNYCDNYECEETCSGGTIDVCPVLGNLSITSDTTVGGTELSMVVENLFPVFNAKRALTDTLLCIFESESYRYNSSTLISFDIVNCTTVAAVAGIYDFYLADSDFNEITEPIQFEYYYCPDKTCSECTSGDYRCEYCDGACNVEGTCVVQDGCPDILSISPATVTFTGGFIDITVEYFSINTNVTCVIDNIESIPLSISESIVSCKVPGSSPGIKDVYLIIGNEITGIHQIEVYDCSPSTTSCDDCLSDIYPECSFCGGKCQLQCSGERQGCPIIESLHPLIAEIVDSTIFTVVFETTLPSSPLRCLFEGTQQNYYSAATANDTNTITCSVPNGITEESYTFGVEVNYVDDFVQYSVFGDPVYLYECSGDLSCDESCFSEYCTFCSGVGCVGNTSCTTETSISLCPEISDTSSISYSVDTSKSISFLIDGFVPGDLPLFCHFTDDSNSVYEMEANFTDGIITCFTPVLGNVNSMILDVKYGNTIITHGQIEIFVVDCSVASLCDGSFTQTLCINLEHCGWCLSSHSCVEISECSEDSDFLTDSECPTFSGVYPNVTDVNEQVYLTGLHFYPFSLVAKIVDDYVNVSYVNETHLLVKELPDTVPRDQEIQIILEFEDGSEYLPYGKKFTVNADLIIEPNYLLLIVILVGCGLLLIILIIVGIVMWHKKRAYDVFAGINIRLERPDFSDLAYGKDGSTLEYTNLPKDNFDVFEELLISDRSKIIFSAFLDTLNPTDQDRGTKYFVYLTEINGCTTEFIKSSMATEIQNCDESATIFRGNSNASKMFKTYSKINGSPYIFEILGKYIQQLSALSDTELGAYGLELELDEYKAKDADLESNSMQLKFVCNKILSAILNSINEVPLSFKEIFQHVALNIDISGFDEADTSLFAVGGLFFLRFVIPSIFAPHLYGLLPNPPSSKTQRSLVLIAKVIQNIANMVLPGKKEEYMIFLNSYIQNSIPKVKHFYEQLTDISTGSFIQSPTPPPHLRMNALCSLFTIFNYNRAKIEENIMYNAEYPDPFLRKIEIAMSSYDPPVKIKEPIAASTKKKSRKN